MTEKYLCLDQSTPAKPGQQDALSEASPSPEALICPADLRPACVDGLYMHVPFCFHKCHYCDFYSIVDDRDRQAAFTDRLIEEIRTVAPQATNPLTTIFCGGGTPTLLAVEHWKRLLAALADAFDLSALVEFTTEANPETVTPELLDTLAAGGVNRVSVGAQSFNERHLKTLERWHDPANVERAVGFARAAGIDNVNVDLIFAVPGQTLDEWRADLDRALAIEPTHISAYALTYEPNTPMTTKLRLGRIERADNAVETAMFEATMSTLVDAGFEQYEVSNYAKRDGLDRRCQHNLGYWRNANWLAVGPSASGHIDGVRWKNAPHLGQYLASTGPSPVVDVEQLDASASLGERIMLGLRLMEGMDWPALDTELDPARRERIEVFIAENLMQRADGRLRLTSRGLMIADSVLADLL